MPRISTRKWISHLRGLPDDPAIKVFCSGWKKPASKKGPARNIAKPLVEALTNEMITSARRSNLSQRLAKAIVANEKNAINLDEVRSAMSRPSPTSSLTSSRGSEQRMMPMRKARPSRASSGARRPMRPGTR